MKSMLKGMTVLSVIAFMALAACQPASDGTDSSTNTPTMEETTPETTPEVAPDGGASIDTVTMDSVPG